MKFQNPSMHDSKDMVCIKKRDGRRDGHTDRQPKTIKNLQTFGA